MSASDEFAYGGRPPSTATQLRSGLAGAFAISHVLTETQRPVCLSLIWPGLPVGLWISNCCKGFFVSHAAIESFVALDVLPWIQQPSGLTHVDVVNPFVI